MQLGKGVYVKGLDYTFSGWLVASANRCKDTHPHSVAEMIRKWNDRNDKTFSCDLNLEEAKKIKELKRSNWIK